MSYRKICPKEWSFVKLTTKEGSIFYKKVRKLNRYSSGISIPKTIVSEFKIERFDKGTFPLSFSAKIIKESESYFYTIIPSEIVKLLNLKEKDILMYKFNDKKILFGKLRKTCNSLRLIILKELIRKKSVEMCNITLLKKLKLSSPIDNIKLCKIKDILCFDLKSLLPKFTSRDNNPFGIYELNNKKMLVCVRFKHVKGKDFKNIILPRYLDANKTALFFGLMHSDGFKKFGYREIYKKYINSPYVGFANGEPSVINLYLSLFEDLFIIKRKNFKANLKYPLKLSVNQKYKLKKFWYEILENEPSIYQDTKRDSKWCPVGILNIGLFNILMAEIIISCLKKFLKWTNRSNLKNVKVNFINGVLIGDGSPILDKGTLRRIMIAIEFKSEGDMYKEILNSLGYKSNNLWPKNNKKVPTHLRTLDIQGNTEFIERLLNNFSFGFWKNNKFYGSLEKQYRFLNGSIKLTKLDKKPLKELNKIKSYLKDYIGKVDLFLPIPQKYRSILK